MDTSEIEANLKLACEFAIARKYAGNDPYDGIFSGKLENIRNRWIKYLFIQLQVSSPVNFRPFLGIGSGVDIKGLGLFFKAYLTLKRLESSGIKILDSHILDREIEWIRTYLMDHSLIASHGLHCWSGHYFNVQGRKGFLSPNQPEIISSTLIGEGMIEYHHLFGDKQSLEVVKGVRDFLARDLLRNEDGWNYFGYSPGASGRIVYNATALGCKFSRSSGLLLNESSQISIKRMMDLIRHVQNSDGSWNYSFEPETGRMGKQIDFHQGFILDSLIDFAAEEKMEGIAPIEGTYQESLLKGADFYWNKQFLPDGRSKWRWPRQWPVDSHNQAQGIITFSKLKKFDPKYLDHAFTVANWSMRNMMGESGGFYYQKWPFFTNKIEYMRWSQAWMILALATLLENCHE